MRCGRRLRGSLAHEVSCRLLYGGLGGGHHCKLLHHAIVLGVALGLLAPTCCIDAWKVAVFASFDGFNCVRTDADKFAM